MAYFADKLHLDARVHQRLDDQWIAFLWIIQAEQQPILFNSRALNEREALDQIGSAARLPI